MPTDEKNAFYDMISHISDTISTKYEPQLFNRMNERDGVRYVYDRTHGSGRWLVETSPQNWVVMSVNKSNMQPLYDLCSYISGQKSATDLMKDILPPLEVSKNIWGTFDGQTFTETKDADPSQNPRVIEFDPNHPGPRYEPITERRQAQLKEMGFSGLASYDRLDKKFLVSKEFSTKRCQVSGELVAGSLMVVRKFYGLQEDVHVSSEVYSQLTLLSDTDQFVFCADPVIRPTNVDCGSVVSCWYSLKYITDNTPGEFFVDSHYGYATVAASRLDPNGTRISYMRFQRTCFVCSDCGDTFFRNEHPHSGSRCLCSHCYVPELRSDGILHAYSTDAMSMFGARNKDGSYDSSPDPFELYFGLELELEFGDDENDASRAAQEAKKRRLAVMCSDGSLDDGGEFKTPPVHTKVAAEHVSDLLEILNEGEGFRAERTCGLHIHASRSCLSELTIKRMGRFMYNPQNTAFLEFIAGRPGNNSYSRFRVEDAKTMMRLTKDIPSAAVVKFLDKKKERTVYLTKALSSRNPGTESKYQGLYVHGRGKTIELRLFKGTLEKARVLMCLNFTQAYIAFCAENSSNKYQDFLKFILEPRNRKEYKHLLSYLREFSSYVPSKKPVPAKYQSLNQA